MNQLKNQRGMLDVIVLVLVVGLIAIAGASIYFKHQAQQAGDKAAQSNQESKSIVNKAKLAPDPYVGWKTFTSKAEGFSLRYPTDWKLTDSSSGNCAHAVANGSDCRERFIFEAPTDGIEVIYAVHRDDNSDKISCGTQSFCDTQNIQSVQTLSIPKLGKLLYVEVASNDQSTTPGIYLDVPLSTDTTPKVGANHFANYMIDYSLPAKSAGRFAIALHPVAGNTDLVGDKFFASAAVKQGELILKSFTY